MDLATLRDTGRTLAVLVAVEGAPRRSSTTITGMTAGNVEDTMSRAMSGRWDSRRITILGRSTPRVIAIRPMVQGATQAQMMIRGSIRIRVWTTRRSPIAEAMMVRAVETTATSLERRAGNERGLRDAGLFSFFARGRGGRRWFRRRSGRCLPGNR